MARRRKPIRPMKYPIGQEYAYRRILQSLLVAQKKLLMKYMAPKVPALAADATVVDLPTGVLRQDEGWQDDLRKILLRIAKEMVPPTNAAIRQTVRQVGPAVDRYNKEEWRKLIRSQYGVDPTRESPDQYKQFLDEWSRYNARLIKDVPAQSLRQIQEVSQKALLEGTVQKDVERDIYDIMSERMDVADSRVRLIARDQVSKLNGNLTEQRQTDIGVDSYIWRTVGDERVRDTHEENDGQQFSWDNPPTETGHPGEDINCRCWAEPVLPETLMFEASLEDDLEEAA